MRIRKDSSVESLVANTNLGQEDIKNMGPDFLCRVQAVRRQMDKWNDQGHSYHRVMAWAQHEEFKQESKISPKKIEKFGHEVDLLKRIIMLAEFCKASGLNFQTEYAKHCLVVRREKAARRLLRAILQGKGSGKRKACQVRVAKSASFMNR